LEDAQGRGEAFSLKENFRKKPSGRNHFRLQGWRKLVLGGDQDEGRKGAALRDKGPAWKVKRLSGFFQKTLEKVGENKETTPE